MRPIRHAASLAVMFFLFALPCRVLASDLTGTWVTSNLHSVSALSLVENGGHLQATLHMSEFSNDGTIHHRDTSLSGVAHDGQFQLQTPPVLGMSSSLSGYLQGRRLLLLSKGHLWALHRVPLSEYMRLDKDLQAIRRFTLAAYEIHREDVRMQHFAQWANARRKRSVNVQHFYETREEGYQYCLKVMQRAASQLFPGHYDPKPSCFYSVTDDSGPKTTAMDVHKLQSQYRSMTQQIDAHSVHDIAVIMDAAGPAWEAARQLDPHDHTQRIIGLHQMAVHYRHHHLIRPRSLYPHYQSYIRAKHIGADALERDARYVSQGMGDLNGLASKIRSLGHEFDRVQQGT